jgi:sensor histidine kinase YesM
MKVHRLFIFSLLIFLSLVIVSKAQNTNAKDVFLLKEVTKEKQSLKGYVSLLCDSLGTLSIEQVSSLDYDTLFKKESEWDTSFVVNPKSALWIKVSLQNTTEETHWRIGKLLVYNNVVYYSPDGVQFYIAKSGMNYKPSERYLPYHLIANYSVPIFLTHKTQDIYIKTSAHFTDRVTLQKESIRRFLDEFYIIPEKQVEIAHTTETNFEILFFGVCICMLLYNLFIYLFVKDKSYLYYSLAIAGVAGYFVFLEGYYVTVLFDVGRTRWERDLDDFISAFSADLSIFFFLSFSQVFLFAQQKKTLWYKILGYLKWYLLIANGTFKGCLLLANTFAYNASQLFHNVNYGLVILVLFVLSIDLWRNKNKIHLYYVYANLPLFVLTIVYIFYAYFNRDRANIVFLLDNSFQMGIMLQIISFSIALAARINFMRHEIEQKKFDNEQLNHRLLRTQMNPHFIFNSLTSIQNYLFENEPQKTALYLAKFSKLMRQILESSREDFISLAKEIKTLENYLDLQKMRFGDKLNFEIKIAPEIDSEEVQIPPMFAQPFIENSLEHGILHRSNEGFISIEFKKVANVIVLSVEDNGVGLSQSKTLRSEVKKEYKSLATQITQERLSLLRQKHQLPLDFVIQELKTQLNEVAGTQVQVKLPFQIA